MGSDRLTLAAASGLFAAPLAVFGGRADHDLSSLPQPVQVIQTDRTQHDALVAAGLAPRLEPEGRFASSLVILPRAKALARDRIARAAALTDGPVIVDGQKIRGIDSLLREIRARADVGDVISKNHGKCFAVTGGDFSDWLADSQRIEGGFLTPPGAFSADGIDPGSRLLADALPPLAGTVIDLGAGWGYLAARALASAAVTDCHLVEADHDSLACARRNVPDPRAAFHWADATRPPTLPPADHVVMNPPFHQGRRDEPDLGRAFIARAAGLLAPRGRLWLVANRHLPYEAELTARFARHEELPGSAGFKLLRAERPRNASR